jgi:hypothetical protein
MLNPGEHDYMGWTHIASLFLTKNNKKIWKYGNPTAPSNGTNNLYPQARPK